MDFPPMMSNSALMQSYNLMKMSSEVTKYQGTPQFSAQDRKPDYNYHSNKNPHMDYQNKQQMDFNGKPQLEYNMNTFQPQKSAPPSQSYEQYSEEQFLGRLKNYCTLIS